MSIFHAAFGINPTTELQDPHIISLSPLKGCRKCYLSWTEAEEFLMRSEKQHRRQTVSTGYSQGFLGLR